MRGEWLRRDLTVERASTIRSRRTRLVRRAPRRNDSEWRTEVMALRGNACRVPGCELWPIEADHLIPRAHGGPSVGENGLPLCRAHHGQKTAHTLLIEQSWLDFDQVEWLREQGYAWWETDGTVSGPRCTIFAPLVVA